MTIEPYSAAYREAFDDHPLFPPLGLRQQEEWRKVEDARQRWRADEEQLWHRVERAKALVPRFADAYPALTHLLPKIENAAEQAWSNGEVRDMVRHHVAEARSPRRLENAAMALWAALNKARTRKQEPRPESAQLPTAAANAVRAERSNKLARKAQRMRADGMSVPQIASAINRTDRRVRDLLKIDLDRK